MKSHGMYNKREKRFGAVKNKNVKSMKGSCSFDRHFKARNANKDSSWEGRSIVVGDCDSRFRGKDHVPSIFSHQKSKTLKVRLSICKFKRNFKLYRKSTMQFKKEMRIVFVQGRNPGCFNCGLLWHVRAECDRHWEEIEEKEERKETKRTKQTKFNKQEGVTERRKHRQSPHSKAAQKIIKMMHLLGKTDEDMECYFVSIKSDNNELIIGLGVIWTDK